MPFTTDLVQFDTITALRAHPIADNVKAFTAGKLSIEDGLGGFFYWNPTSTLAEDAFLNTVISDTTPTGRWIRLFQRARSIPQGYVAQNGPVKKVFIDAVTDANGRATVNLTMDNTPTGTPIFAEIWDNRSYVTTPQTNIQNVISSCVYANAAGLVSTTHQFFKPNSVIPVVSVLLVPVANAPAGTAVRFIVEGV